MAKVDEDRRTAQFFRYEAGELSVGFTVWATSYPIFGVRDTNALRALREAVAGEYRIVVQGDIDDYVASDRGVDWARQLIREAT